MPKLYTRILVCSLLLLIPVFAQAQEFTQDFKALNALYLEVGGNGDSYSVNYDRIVFQHLKYKSAIRVGVGSNLFILNSEPSAYPIVPIEAVEMIGNKYKHLEVGLGYTRRFTDDESLIQNMFFGRVGLRYQKPRGGLVVRVAVTPFISPEKSTKTPGVALVPRFGFSVGRSL